MNGEPIGIVTERHPVDLVWKQSDGEEPHSTAPKLQKTQITNKKRNLYSKKEVNSPNEKHKNIVIQNHLVLIDRMSWFATHNVCSNTSAVSDASTIYVERHFEERVNRLQTTRTN